MLLVPYLMGATLIGMGALFLLLWLAWTRWEVFFAGAATIGVGAFIIWAYNAFGPVPW